MALTPYDPFRPMDVFKRGLDRFFHDFPTYFPFGEGLGSHRVDLYETDGEMIASCEIPGLEKKEDVRIEVQGDMLMISGVVQRSGEVEDERLHRRERFTGRFHRQIPLPSAVKGDAVKASYRNGILEIRMPKASPSDIRQIDVEFH